MARTPALRVASAPRGVVLTLVWSMLTALSLLSSTSPRRARLQAKRDVHLDEPCVFPSEGPKEDQSIQWKEE